MLHKFLLTSVIIFVKPGTTAQLAAAFVINLAFLVLHVQTQAFITKAENDAQFNGLVGIALTLFSGIVLKYDELSNESEDSYNRYTILIVLMGSQMAVVFMFGVGVASLKEKTASPGLWIKVMDWLLPTEAMDLLRNQPQQLLDQLEVTVNDMVEEKKIEPELGELFGVLKTEALTSFREMDAVSTCLEH